LAPNPVLVEALARLKSYLDYGMFTPIQVTAIMALERSQECLAQIRDLYWKRRNVLCDGLNSVGWQIEKTAQHYVCLGPHSRALSSPWISGIFQETAVGGQGGSIAWHWFW
jgi:aspartate/methionine/tyrosine aminotransferase